MFSNLDAYFQGVPSPALALESGRECSGRHRVSFDAENIRVSNQAPLRRIPAASEAAPRDLVRGRHEHEALDSLTATSSQVGGFRP